jgi:hypothetical protein
MIKKSILSVFAIAMLLSAAFASAQILFVKYKCTEKNLGAQQIMFNFMVYNNTGVPVPLSELKIRYYYSKESPSSEEFHLEYAAIGTQNIEGQFFPGYVEISFKANAGVIPNAGDCGEIQVRLNMRDWMVYDQSNDYSFDPSRSEYADYTKIALYWKGSRVWGMEGMSEQILSELKPSPIP